MYLHCHLLQSRFRRQAMCKFQNCINGNEYNKILYSLSGNAYIYSFSKQKQKNGLNNKIKRVK